MHKSLLLRLAQWGHLSTFWLNELSHRAACSAAAVLMLRHLDLLTNSNTAAETDPMHLARSLKHLPAALLLAAPGLVPLSLSCPLSSAQPPLVLCSAAELDPLRLARFLRRVEEGYNNNPYHNRVHAADVVQSMHMLMTVGGLATLLGTEMVLLAGEGCTGAW